MFQKARDTVPLDTIERAVKRGTGELEGVNYEPITYEGYAPGGVALFIETSPTIATAPVPRSAHPVEERRLMAEPGAVSWQFEWRVWKVERAADEDEPMMVGLDHGAEDVQDLGELWQVTCEATDVVALRAALEEAELPVTESDVTFLPTKWCR